MSHNSFFVGYTDPIPNGHTPDGTEYTLLWKQLYAAINGDDGGTWAPGAFITVGGSGFQFTGTAHSLAAAARLTVQSTGEIRLANGALLRADGTAGDIRLEVLTNVATLTVQANAVVEMAGAFNVKANGLVTVEDTGGVAFADGATALFQSGSLLQVDDGGTVTLAGDLNVSATGVVTFQNSSNVSSGSSAFAQWNGEWWFAGTTKFVSSTWPQLDPARTWHRAGKKLIPLTFSDGGTDGTDPPDAWEEQSNINPLTPCWRTLATGTTGGASLIEFDGLPQNGNITTVTITTRGTISIDVNTLPTYRIVRWKDTAAFGLTYVSNIKTDDAHTADDFFFITGTTTITANANTAIDNQYRYGLLITHPYRSGSTQGMRIYSVQINGTVASLEV